VMNRMALMKNKEYECKSVKPMGQPSTKHYLSNVLDVHCIILSSVGLPQIQQEESVDYEVR